MNKNDQRLGMDRAIVRRDFLSGASMLIGAAMLPASISKAAMLPGSPNSYYPPAEMGMRGSHPGSFENAHATVQGKEWTPKLLDEHYDLIIVGAGISGLTAAYIHIRDVDTNARILILDNHDDFGGHAKRNEFTVDGKMLIGYGGTMFVDAPQKYPAVAKRVMEELGIKEANDDAYVDSELFSSYGLGRGTFFDKETFGADHLASGELESDETLERTPLSASAKEELKRLLADDVDYLDGMTQEERRSIIETISWREYLKKYAGAGDEVLSYFQKRTHGIWAIGADALPAWMALDSGYPGFGDMDLGEDKEEPLEDAQEDAQEEKEDSGGRFRFPDGNASVARLLVRKLIPGVADGTTMEDVVSDKFDYAALDLPNNQTRIRLSSTAVEIAHKNGDLNADVIVTYGRGDDAFKVSGKKVIWAGYHALLPFVCKDVPSRQIDALSSSVRAPLVYTNVAIRNWQALVNLGVSGVYCPGSFFSSVGPTHAVSYGDYEFTKSPDEPMILHLQHVPLAPGLPAPDQFRKGRYALLDTPFETFERNVRDQLGRMFGAGGFDPARDIAGITVNRWPHGYAYSVNKETNEVAWYPEKWPVGQRPWEEARKRIGNIAIAGTDAASNAMTEAAMVEAHRAVHSLLE